MKNMKIIKGAFLSFAMLLMATLSWAQRSPAATATGTIGGANITIRYNSPFVKGRAIWGGLVPFGKVWRAGADSATRFETDKDIKIEGKKLPAGLYTLYLLVNENECTVIISSQRGQWGITRAGETTEDPAKDVLRVNVKPKKSDMMNESLSYKFNSKGFVLSWENWDIPVSIK